MSGDVSGLKDLIEKHVATLKSEGIIAIEAIRQSPPDIQVGKDAAHKVKGSSGSLGFSELSDTALHVERHLGRLLTSGESITQETLDLVTSLDTVLSELSAEKSSLF